MDPALVGLLYGGLVVLGMGLAFAAIAWGARSRNPEVEFLRGALDGARAQLAQERARNVAQASGARTDLERAAARASAADSDGVLDAVYGPEPEAASGEHGRQGDQGGAGSHA